MPPASLTISVIIPLYNGQRFIEEALASVARQTFPVHELIVVDDGSTDEGMTITQQFARTYPLKLLTKLNGGQSSARNFGIAHSTGTHVALLDQDDIWYPNHLEELAREFVHHQTDALGWTYSNLDEIDEDGRLIERNVINKTDSVHPKTDLRDCLRQDMFILPSASLISRQAFDAVGGFDERLSGYEDDDLFIRLFSAGYRNTYVEKALSQWRIYTGSASFSLRMSNSRMIYARKLIDTYADDVLRNIFYARDLIVPRFLNEFVETLRRALRVGDYAVADACKAHVETLEALVNTPDRQRLYRNNLVITAVIPLYNGAEFIEEALRSVLGQTLPPDEIIVVDDGSEDDGPAIVLRLSEIRPIRLLHKTNGGQSSARNHGIQHAHGDLIALLDQDDVWYPSHLAELVTPFQQSRPRPLGWSYSNLDEIDRSGELITQSYLTTLSARHPKTNIFDCLGQDMFVLPSASLIARRAIEAIGCFDERLSGYEDDDLFIRLLYAGYDNVYLDKALSQWRIFHGSSSCTPRMVRSRMIYARKLIEGFPDDLAKARYQIRDLIAPRFVAHALSEVRKALASTDEAWIEASLADLRFLQRLLKTNDARSVIRRNPLISAIVPLFNGEGFIEEAIQSILAQTLKPDEIIVVDDGSTDNGPSVVARLAETSTIRLIRQENAGQSSARNIGVDHAHGDLIAFLDQDDIWYSDHLARLVEPFLEERPVELGWCYSNLDEINKDGAVICCGFLDTLEARHPKRDIFSCLAGDMFVLPSASLISRQAFLKVGGFDERLSGYEDDDLFLRMFHAGFENVYLKQSLSKWRIYQSSCSYSSRMAASRATYARKLIEQFPNDEESTRFYVRDLIAPRFFRGMTTELRKAVLKGTKGEQDAALANLRFITGHLRLMRRLAIQSVFLPAMRIPPLARFIMRYRVALAGTLRKIV